MTPLNYAALQFVVIGILSLTNCTQKDSSPPKLNQPAKSISINTGGCYGPCPVFDLSLDSTGKGIYTGRYYVKKTGEHDFKVNAADFENLRVHLAQYRPIGKKVYDSGDACSEGFVTDNPSVLIKWDNSDELYIYLGCRFKNSEKISDAVYNSWRKLPIDYLVGSDEQRDSYKGF